MHASPEILESDNDRGTRISTVLVTIDGPSKSGKTTLLQCIQDEHDALLTPAAVNLVPRECQKRFQEEFDPYRPYMFGSVATVSAGNYFRAATWLRLQEGADFEGFNAERHSDSVLEFMEDPDNIKYLQNDPEIGREASDTGAIATAQTFCVELFRKHVEHIVTTSERIGKLVVVDARNPIALLQKQPKMIGGGKSNAIDARAVLPLLLENSPERAAQNEGGDYPSVLENVKRRRAIDEHRRVNPYHPPDSIDFSDYCSWLTQLTNRDKYGLPPHLRIDGDQADLDNMQYLGGLISQIASDTGIDLHRKTCAGSTVQP